MSEKRGQITIGFEQGTGADVQIDPCNHIFTSGVTGVGKSILMRALMSRVTKDMSFKVLIIDTKKQSDYAPYFPNIPAYIRQREDPNFPTLIKRILETRNDMFLGFQFPELIKLCEHNRTWQEVYEELCKMLEGKDRKRIHPVREDKLVVLRQLLGEFVKEMRTVKLADTIKLDHPVQVMNLSNLSIGLQQLVVKSVSEFIMEKCSNVILMLDEFHRIAPRGLIVGAAQEQIRTHIKEGRAGGNFIWASNQDISETDYQVRRQFNIWLIGRQNDDVVAAKVARQTIDKSAVTYNDVYRMKQGFFLLNDFTTTRTMMFYAWPDGLSREHAQQVAQGKIDVKRVADALDNKRKKDEEEKRKKIRAEGDEQDEEVWRQRFEEEKKAHSADNAKYDLRILALNTKINQQVVELDKLKKHIMRPQQDVGIASPFPATEQPDIKVTADRISVQVVDRPAPREFDTSNVRGQIMYLMCTEFKDRTANRADVIAAAAEHGWKLEPTNTSKRVSELVGEGSLVITDGGAYRLPTKCEFNAIVAPPLKVVEEAVSNAGSG